MNLKDLNEEQKKQLVLGAVVAVVLVIVIVFGVKVSLSSISVAKQELKGLTEKIESAEKSVSKNKHDEQEFLATIAELTTHLENMPPDQNYYSWATELIYEEARMIRFGIDSIDELNLPSSADASDEPQVVEMQKYALRITAHGGYGNVKRFLKRITVNHPLIRVTGLEISTGTAPDVHDVQLFIEWPFNMGSITEAWESVPAQTNALPVEPAMASETVEPDPKNKPVPPPSRPNRDAPPVSAGITGDSN